MVFLNQSGDTQEPQNSLETASKRLGNFRTSEYFKSFMFKQWAQQFYFNNYDYFEGTIFCSHSL